MAEVDLPMNDSIMQTLWVGPRLSTMSRMALQSFLDHGHEVHLYCYARVDGAPAGIVFRDAGEILPEHQVFAYRSGFGRGSYSAFSNYFRYKLLLDRGGWWVDADVVCLRPWTFEEEHVFASERVDRRTDSVTTSSCAIKQPAGSPLMAWTWKACQRTNPDDLRWGEVGPRLLHEAVETFGWWESVRRPQVFNPVDSFDWGALVDAARAPVLGTDTCAVHLWHQMWREHGADPEARYDADCLYERLKRRVGAAEGSRV
jgi:hypothetical protein